MDILRKTLAVLLFCYSTLVFAAQAININTADKATLMSIKGVGESRAEAIIAWREKNGPFKSVDQLKDVQGIGQAILDSNRENLTVKDVE
jgi:competence protein ComEA